MASNIMSEELIIAFQAMLSQSNFAEALKIVSIKRDEIPPPSVINDILTNILMKNCVKKIALEANTYLSTYLNLLPNKSQPFQYDYARVLYNTNGEFKDMWSIFSYIIESCFAHYKIPTGKEITEASEVIKYPNCSILMNFYVNVLTEILSVQNLFDDKPQECFSSLLNWIRVAFNHHNLLEIHALLQNLQKVLDRALQSYMLDRHPNDSSEEVHDLVGKCSSFFKSANSLQLLGALTELPVFHSKICQYIMYERLYDKSMWRNIHSPLTLKTLISHYFFEESSEVNYEPPINNESEIRSRARKKVKNLFKNDDKKGDGILHRLCRKDEFGDLLETLLDHPNLDPNPKNHALRTPLHKACLAKSFFSVENLLEMVEEVSGKVDLEAADKYGFTPLHCAVYLDSVEIARLLLKHGGSPLLALKDNFGEEPITYAYSESMKELLLSFELPFKFDKTNYDVRTYRDQEECYIFLYGLNIVLKNYIQNFKLDKYKKDVSNILSHKEKKCPHYVHATYNLPLTGDAVCDEDASVFECLPLILDHYLENIQRISEESGYDTRVKVLPLVIFRNKLDKGA